MPWDWIDYYRNFIKILYGVLSQIFLATTGGKVTSFLLMKFHRPLLVAVATLWMIPVLVLGESQKVDSNAVHAVVLGQRISADTAVKRLQQRVEAAHLAKYLPKGVSFSYLGSERAEDGWYQVEIRDRRSADSGFDPNVSSSLGMFYVHESRDEILWYDVVTDTRRPFSDFVKSWTDS